MRPALADAGDQVRVSRGETSKHWPGHVQPSSQTVQTRASLGPGYSTLRRPTLARIDLFQRCYLLRRHQHV